jgi:UDP-glucuronate decarboxylase
MSREVTRTTPDDLIRLSTPVSKVLVDSELEVVVTGAGGWLGRATLEMLDNALGTRADSRVHAYGSTGRWESLRSGRRVLVRPLTELPALTVGPHLFTHLAFSTREHAERQGVDAYVAGNRGITELVVGHLGEAMPVGLFMPSSGAVYRGEDGTTNPYGALKLEDEFVMLELASPKAPGSNHCRTVIPRVFNLGGQFLNKPSAYALGSILGDIGRGGPVRLKADHPVVRSYVHVADLIELAFAVMLGPGPIPDRPFDTAGEREIEIGELATMAIEVCGRPDILIERPKMSGTAADRYVGDGSIMHRLANDYGVALRTLPQQIRDTAFYMGI